MALSEQEINEQILAVEKKLRDAFDIQHRTREKTRNLGPQGFSSYWPEIRRNMWEDAPPDAKTSPAVPSPREVDRAAEVIGWLKCLDKSDAKLVKLRVEPYRGKDEEKDLGRSFGMIAQRFPFRFKTRAKPIKRTKGGAGFYSELFLEQRYTRNLGKICFFLNKLQK
jgi:hypothetical protein